MTIVKHILTQHGYLSQFVNFNTYDHGNPRDQRKSSTILQGVARQILSKCGVRVWWVNLPREIPMPAVFVGVDVFHAPRKYNAQAGKRSPTSSRASARRRPCTTRTSSRWAAASCCSKAPPPGGAAEILRQI